MASATPAPIPMEQERQNQFLIEHQALLLSDALQAHRLRLFPPMATKTLRSFQPAEAAKFLNIKVATLRKLALEGKAQATEVSPAGRRLYSADQINELRHYLDKAGRSSKGYVPHRRDGDRLQIIATLNFKGGSGKTTTAAHLAQHLALRGYRVLAIDLDPQASLSAMHGIQPEFDLEENSSIYGAIRYDEFRKPLASLIRKTNFPGLDIVPGSIELGEFEYDTPLELLRRQTAQDGGEDDNGFYYRLLAAIESVESNYDVVILDCPPQLGYLTMAAFCAATSLLITIHPQMLDLMSMSQFLIMLKDIMVRLTDVGAVLEYDWVRYLITRYEPGDGPQADMVVFLRSLLGGYVLRNPMLKSSAISDAAISKQTVYEVERKLFTPSTYDRAIEALDAVNNEIETLIRRVWGRGEPLKSPSMASRE